MIMSREVREPTGLGINEVLSSPVKRRSLRMRNVFTRKKQHRGATQQTLQISSDCEVSERPPHALGLDGVNSSPANERGGMCADSRYHHTAQLSSCVLRSLTAGQRSSRIIASLDRRSEHALDDIAASFQSSGQTRNGHNDEYGAETADFHMSPSSGHTSINAGPQDPYYPPDHDMLLHDAKKPLEYVR
jgi:hypothetical protein